MDTKMKNYYDHVQMLMKDNRNDDIVILLKKLYKILKSYNNNDKKFWVKYYLFPKFINYILTYKILNNIEWSIKRFFDIQIMIQTPPPPLYNAKKFC